jgi:CDP-diacylglycerol--glycerol-3-phosphate 3-phosphatidyltransferase
MTGIQVNSIYNVPNALTSIRFALAVAVMALIPLGRFTSALIVFSIVDKIIICGTFIALVEVPESGVASWMATIVVARELLVTSLRAMIEGAGGDFSARDLGKWKMVLQCAAAIAVLLSLIYEGVAWLTYVAPLLLWSAILLTVYSGYDYVMIAARALSQTPTEE